MFEYLNYSPFYLNAAVRLRKQIIDAKNKREDSTLDPPFKLIVSNQLDYLCNVCKETRMTRTLVGRYGENPYFSYRCPKCKSGFDQSILVVYEYDFMEKKEKDELSKL